MAFTCKNGDRIKLAFAGPIPEARFNGGYVMHRGRMKDGKWTSTRCYIDKRELKAKGWDSLGVFRWYRGVLASMLDFGVTHGFKKFAEQREGVPVSAPPQQPVGRGKKRLTPAKASGTIAPLL